MNDTIKNIVRDTHRSIDIGLSLNMPLNALDALILSNRLEKISPVRVSKKKWKLEKGPSGRLKKASYYYGSTPPVLIDVTEFNDIIQLEDGFRAYSYGLDQHFNLRTESVSSQMIKDIYKGYMIGRWTFSCVGGVNITIQPLEIYES